MIKLILGRKGSGKTKKLIELVNGAVEVSKGNVVCVEKERLLTYDVNYRARLADVERYGVKGYDAFYGFLAGIIAGDADITDMFVDATLKICGSDFDALLDFLKKINDLSAKSELDITFTISADEADLPAAIFDFCEKI